MITRTTSPNPPPKNPVAERGNTWRYRWPDETRDEVLARLLKLNAERAEEERLAGMTAGTAKVGKVKRARKNSASDESQQQMQL